MVACVHGDHPEKKVSFSYFNPLPLVVTKPELTSRIAVPLFYYGLDKVKQL